MHAHFSYVFETSRKCIGAKMFSTHSVLRKVIFGGNIAGPSLSVPCWLCHCNVAWSPLPFLNQPFGTVVTQLTVQVLYTFHGSFLPEFKYCDLSLEPIEIYAFQLLINLSLIYLTVLIFLKVWIFGLLVDFERLYGQYL